MINDIMSNNNRMNELLLSNSFQLSMKDNRQISSLLMTLMEKYESPADPLFLLQARMYASQLPVGILKELNRFRLREDHNGSFVISGFEIDDEQIGPTPYLTGKEIDVQSGLREGYMLTLLVSFIGEPFGWANQRNGALINNILPLKDHAQEQLSTGSMVELDWHTEEAFHSCRADYLALMCMRNPDQIPTMIGSIQDIQISKESKKILFESRFLFLTDKNFEGNGSSIPEPVLYGNVDTPYVKIDPSFMQAVPGDNKAKEALTEIVSAMNAVIYEQVLDQGDILFIDNHRIVHGRKAFQPRFDGTDRWLKRVNITSDLKKSRGLRNENDSRVIIINEEVHE
jgi:hypothetical protein